MTEFWPVEGEQKWCGLLPGWAQKCFPGALLHSLFPSIQVEEQRPWKPQVEDKEPQHRRSLGLPPCMEERCPLFTNNLFGTSCMQELNLYCVWVLIYVEDSLLQQQIVSNILISNLVYLKHSNILVQLKFQLHEATDLYLIHWWTLSA